MAQSRDGKCYPITGNNDSLNHFLDFGKIAISCDTITSVKSYDRLRAWHLFSGCVQL